MKPIDTVDLMGCRFYRLNVESTLGYINGESGAIAAAPLIHTYNPTALVIYSRFALKKVEDDLYVGQKKFQVTRFLTVQALNLSLLTDEDGVCSFGVKPHYALAPSNNSGSTYSSFCATLVKNQDQILYFGNSKVDVHDGLVSPKINMHQIQSILQQSFRIEKSIDLISYVVDPINQQILITHHCLVTDKDYGQLFDYLDSLTTPALEHVLDNSALAIHKATHQFNESLATKIQDLAKLFPAQRIATTPLPQRITPSSSLKNTSIINSSKITLFINPKKIDDEIRCGTNYYLIKPDADDDNKQIICLVSENGETRESKVSSIIKNKMIRNKIQFWTSHNHEQEILHLSLPELNELIAYCDMPESVRLC